MRATAAALTEEILPGGTTNTGLVTRLGDTVRRPRRPTSGSTKALLDHLERVGFDGAPRYLGVDEKGREILTYIPGESMIEPHPPLALTDAALISVAKLLRRYHEAAATFDPTGYPWPHPIPGHFRTALVSHNDPNLDNIIFREGQAVALIDFDLASPGSTAWDLACTARLWVPMRELSDAPPAVRDRIFDRLAIFADAYGASLQQREGLVDAVAECHRWCYSIVQHAVAEGHERFSFLWRRGGRLRAERTSRWLTARVPQMRESLGLR
jgi:hypothetical protein